MPPSALRRPLQISFGGEGIVFQFGIEGFDYRAAAGCDERGAVRLSAAAQNKSDNFAGLSEIFEHYDVNSAFAAGNDEVFAVTGKSEAENYFGFEIGERLWIAAR